MTEKPVIQPQDKYVLRLPDGMRDQLKESAAANSRSLNAEIIARIEESYTLVQDLKRLEAQLSIVTDKQLKLEEERKKIELLYESQISAKDKRIESSERIIRGLVGVEKDHIYEYDDNEKKKIFDAVMFLFGVPIQSVAEYEEIKGYMDIIGYNIYVNDDGKPYFIDAPEGVVFSVFQQMAVLMNPIVRYLQRQGWKMEPPEDWPTDDEVLGTVVDLGGERD